MLKSEEYKIAFKLHCTGKEFDHIPLFADGKNMITLVRLSAFLPL